MTWLAACCRQLTCLPQEPEFEFCSAFGNAAIWREARRSGLCSVCLRDDEIKQVLCNIVPGFRPPIGLAFCRSPKMRYAKLLAVWHFCAKPRQIWRARNRAESAQGGPKLILNVCQCPGRLQTHKALTRKKWQSRCPGQRGEGRSAEENNWSTD